MGGLNSNVYKAFNLSKITTGIPLIYSRKHKHPKIFMRKLLKIKPKINRQTPTIIFTELKIREDNPPLQPTSKKCYVGKFSRKYITPAW